MREEDTTNLPAPLRGTTRPSIGRRDAEVVRAKLRRCSRAAREEMLHPPLAQKVAEAVTGAITALAQMLGQDEDAVTAKLADALGVTSDRVLVWAQVGIHDNKAHHRAFFEVVNDFEQGSLARNALRLLHGNGTFAAKLAQRIRDFRQAEKMSVSDLACYVSLLHSDVEALEAGRVSDILALVRLHSITGLVPELDRATENGTHAEHL